MDHRIGPGVISDLSEICVERVARPFFVEEKRTRRASKFQRATQFEGTFS